MKKRMSLLLVHILLFGTLIVQSQTSIARANSYSIDPTSPMEYALRFCTSAQDLDCLESFTVLYPDGHTLTPKLIAAPTGTTTNGIGLARENSGYTFTYAKNSPSGAITNIFMNMRVQTPAYQEDYLPFKVPRFLFEFNNAAALGKDDKFQVVFRTSWLKPLDAALYGKNATFKDELISGGHRFTMGVSKSQFAYFKSVDSANLSGTPAYENMRADAVEDRMYFGINHANSITGQSAYDTNCSEKGYTVESSNAVTAGQPYMESSESLNFSIAAPHLKPDGSLNEGYFLAQIHQAWIDCKWPGNTLTKNTGFTLEVIEPNGVKQVVTTTASLKNGIFYLMASGFHYSSPRVVLTGSIGIQPTPTPTPTPTPSPSLKKSVLKEMSITCIKGKSVKTITALKPKCPTGYKLK